MRTLTLVTVAVLALGLGACDTMTQFGKDLKVAGEKAIAGVVNTVSAAAGSASGTPASTVAVPSTDAATTK